MSKATVLGVIPHRRPIELAELPNSHGWAPSIWKRLVSALYGYDGYIFDGPWLDRLWQSIEELPEWQQAPLVLTFDTGVMPSWAFDWAADQIEEFDVRLPAPEGHVNHLPAMVELLRSAPEVPVLGVWGTNVTENPFDPWDDEADEPGSGISPSEWYVLEGHRSRLSTQLASRSGK